MAGRASQVVIYGLAPGSQPAFATVSSRRGAMSRIFAVVAFAALLASTMMLNAYRIGGFPIRGLAAAGVLLLTVVFFFDEARRALRRNLPVLALAAGLAVLGTFVSIVNGTPAGAILQSLTETHVQAAMIIMVAAVLAQVAGARACAFAIVAMIGISACVALAQMMDVEPAWSLRRALGPLPAEATEGLELLDRRPTGLSFSAIQLSTQLCLAFAAFLAVRDKVRSHTAGSGAADPAVILALLALFAASIVVATRSPILGGFVFLSIYSLQRRTSWLPLVLILTAILLYMAWPLVIGVIEAHAPRVTKTDDNSAAARLTLVYYGWRLFADNPLGYGFSFAPMTLWTSYWQDLYMMPAPQGARETELHNYLATMLNIYGIGILLLAPLLAKVLRQARPSLIFFLPYLVQILFHNSGPFYNDNVIWFVIAAVAAAGHRSEARFDPQLGSAGQRGLGNLQRLHPRYRRPVPPFHALRVP
jgi:O-Antigen ligase